MRVLTLQPFPRGERKASKDKKEFDVNKEGEFLDKLLMPQEFVDEGSVYVSRACKG